MKVYFCLIVRFYPLPPSYQRHPKTKKLGPPPTVMNPTEPQNPLILSHSSILSPASTQIPMALFFYCLLCRCEIMMTFTPLYPTQFDIRQTGFDKLLLYRQNPCFPVQSSRIRVALKAVPTHATPPHLMRSALYQTVKNDCHGKTITAFPHFQLPKMSLCHQTYTVLFQSSSKPVQ